MSATCLAPPRCCSTPAICLSARSALPSVLQPELQSFGFTPLLCRPTSMTSRPTRWPPPLSPSSSRGPSPGSAVAVQAAAAAACPRWGHCQPLLQPLQSQEQLLAAAVSSLLQQQRQQPRQLQPPHRSQPALRAAATQRPLPVRCRRCGHPRQQKRQPQRRSSLSRRAQQMASRPSLAASRAPSVQPPSLKQVGCSVG